MPERMTPHQARALAFIRLAIAADDADEHAEYVRQARYWLDLAKRDPTRKLQ